MSYWEKRKKPAFTGAYVKNEGEFEQTRKPYLE